MGVELLIVGRGNHIGIDRSSEVSDFLRSFVNQKHHDFHFGVIGGDGIGNLFEDRCLSCARRSNDQSPGAFANRSHQINDAGFEHIRSCLQLELFNRINGREIFNTDHLTILSGGHPVDFKDFPQLGIMPTMGRLGHRLDEGAFTEKVPLDGVRGDENVGWFWGKMLLWGSEEAESFFSDFEIPFTIVQW